MSGSGWMLFWLLVAMKIPIVMLGAVLWIAIRAEVPDTPADEDGGTAVDTDPPTPPRPRGDCGPPPPSPPRVRRPGRSPMRDRVL